MRHRLSFRVSIIIVLEFLESLKTGDRNKFELMEKFHLARPLWKSFSSSLRSISLRTQLCSETALRAEVLSVCKILRLSVSSRLSISRPLAQRKRRAANGGTKGRQTYRESEDRQTDRPIEQATDIKAALHSFELAHSH